MNNLYWTLGSPDEFMSDVAMTFGTVNACSFNGENVFPKTKAEAKKCVAAIHGGYKLKIYNEDKGEFTKAVEGLYTVVGGSDALLPSLASAKGLKDLTKQIQAKDAAYNEQTLTKEEQEELIKNRDGKVVSAAYLYRVHLDGKLLSNEEVYDICTK